MHLRKKIFISSIIVLMIQITLTGAGNWPKNVKPVKLKKNASTSIIGNLSKGKILSSLRWASRSSVACFPTTQNDSFKGNHVFFGTTIPSYSTLQITLIPEKNTDLNLYAYMMSTKTFNKLPPKLYSALSCEASYNKGTGKPNPEKSESVYLNSIRNPYNVIIGVAGPKGVTKGKFKLKFEFKTRAEEPKVKGRIKVRVIKSKMNKTMQTKGNLKNGQLMPVRWANSSQVACFPATQNEKFQGNQVFYRTQLPAYSILTIKAIPIDANTDVNLYAYRIGVKDRSNLPPKVHTGAAEASYSPGSHNPGAKETVQFYSANNPYNIIICVSGPKGVTEGKYKLQVKLKSRKR